MFRAVFQSFDDAAQGAAGPGRLAALRTELRRHGFNGFIIPRADEHQGEYVPANAERLAWLTGFTGSAGLAVVLENRAAIFVDGRYVLQAPQQVDETAFTVVPLAETTPEAWLRAHLPAGARLGYDPWLHATASVRRFAKAAEAAGGRLEPVSHNPLDAVWSDRPQPPTGRIRVQPESLAGESAATRLARLRDSLVNEKLDALLISDPHNMAWLFNIRGADVPHTPLALGYALVPREGRPALFLDGRKLTAEAGAALAGVADVAPPAALEERLQQAAAGGARIRLDQTTAAAALSTIVHAAGGVADVGEDPLTLMKARKNTVEIAGSRAAHLRDGAAVTRFLHWFDGAAPAGGVTEIDAVSALETFRRETNVLEDVSFPTISGAGPNGAVVHYRVTTATNAPVGEGMFLIDSGAQYADGTTDITRTIAVGEPDAEMRDRFTRVLQGHIAVATAVFPRGTWGAQIDSFARRPLWEAGLDFDHGTGHGVGSFLSVHEGPQRISRLGNVALEPGMILSNEPGYYKAGAWGIRIENLLVVEERDIPGAERPMLGFETLTLAPIDLRLVEPSLLSDAELAWLNAYHARVREELTPSLASEEERAWLVEATQAIVA